MGGIIRKIPGYGAYSTKESLRNDDRMVREYIADELRKKREVLLGDVSETNDFERVSGIRKYVERISLIEEMIRYSRYGCSALFADVKVSYDLLEELKRIDREMTDRLDKPLNEMLDELERLSGERDMLLKGEE